LHPLLEDGCPGDEVPDDSKKVWRFVFLLAGHFSGEKDKQMQVEYFSNFAG
jgi:hypothetical protein